MFDHILLIWDQYENRSKPTYKILIISKEVQNMILLQYQEPFVKFWFFSSTYKEIYSDLYENFLKKNNTS